MLIHAIGRSSDSQGFLSRIENSITTNDAVLLFGRGSRGNVKRSSDVEAHIEAIGKADAVIIDASQPSFFIGFYAAYAADHKKPLLVVAPQNKQNQSLLSLQGRTTQVALIVSDAELHDAVKTFIVNNTIYTKDLRFNLFIDRPIYNYLRTISSQTGKNKSEIIRDLINREINKQ